MTKTAPLEQAIQNWFTELIKTETLYEKIVNASDFDSDATLDENFAPTFALSDLAARRSVQSARHVMSHLRGLLQLMSADQNISSEPGDSLRPDVVVINPEETSLLLFELKRSAQTTRQAVTELLGYEQEVQNQFPFLSHLDLLHVVVSTEFPVLLDHSLSGLMTWNSKKILCLKVNAVGPESEWNLSVHLPESWSSHYMNRLDGDALATYTLIPYHPSNGTFSEEEIEKIWSRLPMAMDLIARDADVNRSHGFCLLWSDQFKGIPTAGFMLTIGAINPFGFLGAATSLPDTILVAYAVENEMAASTTYPASLYRVADRVKHLFSDVCSMQWEGALNWGQERDQFMYRAVPVAMEFWGVLGEYARDFVTSEFVREHYMSEIKDSGWSWKDPYVGLTLLDDISFPRLFTDGKFMPGDLFKFGAQLGQLAGCYETVKNLNEGEGAGNRALLYWKRYEVFSAMLEIRMRWLAMENSAGPPPTIKNTLDEGAESVSKLCKWINTNFLDGNDLHRLCFSLGTIVYPIGNPPFSSGLTPELQVMLERDASEICRSLISFFAHDLPDDTSPEKVDSLSGIMKAYLSKSLDRVSFKSDVAKILAFSDSEIVRQIPVLLDSAGIFLGDVFHKLAPADLRSIDWISIKRQVLKYAKTSTDPVVVVIQSDGRCSITIQPDIPMKAVTDPGQEVLVMDQLSGFSVVMRKRWDDLIVKSQF